MNIKIVMQEPKGCSVDWLRFACATMTREEIEEQRPVTLDLQKVCAQHGIELPKWSYGWPHEKIEKLEPMENPSMTVFDLDKNNDVFISSDLKDRPFIYVPYIPLQITNALKDEPTKKEDITWREAWYSRYDKE